MIGHTAAVAGESHILAVGIAAVEGTVAAAGCSRMAAGGSVGSRLVPEDRTAGTGRRRSAQVVVHRHSVEDMENPGIVNPIPLCFRSRVDII